jgi:hypothetical protein
MLPQAKHNKKTIVKDGYVLGVYVITSYGTYHTGKCPNAYIGESFSRK